jgi:hypothetical protein
MSGLPNRARRLVMTGNSWGRCAGQPWVHARARCRCDTAPAPEARRDSQAFNTDRRVVAEATRAIERLIKSPITLARP